MLHHRRGGEECGVAVQTIQHNQLVRSAPGSFEVVDNAAVLARLREEFRRAVRVTIIPDSFGKEDSPRDVDHGS